MKNNTNSAKFSLRTYYGAVVCEVTKLEEGLHVQLFLNDGQPLGRLSVQLETEYKLKHNEFWAKTWSENEQLAKDCLASGRFEDMGIRASTGFVEAQLWKYVPEETSKEEKEKQNTMENKLNFVNVKTLESMTWRAGGEMVPKKAYTLYEGKETFAVVISNVNFPGSSLGGKTKVGYTTIHWETGIVCGIHTTIKGALNFDPDRIMKHCPTREAFRAKVETTIRRAEAKAKEKEAKINTQANKDNTIKINSLNSKPIEPKVETQVQPVETQVQPVETQVKSKVETPMMRVAEAIKAYHQAKRAVAMMVDDMSDAISPEIINQISAEKRMWEVVKTESSKLNMTPGAMLKAYNQAMFKKHGGVVDCALKQVSDPEAKRLLGWLKKNRKSFGIKFPFRSAGDRMMVILCQKGLAIHEDGGWKIIYKCV